LNTTTPLAPKGADAFRPTGGTPPPGPVLPGRWIHQVPDRSCSRHRFDDRVEPCLAASPWVHHRTLRPRKGGIRPSPPRGGEPAAAGTPLPGACGGRINPLPHSSSGGALAPATASVFPLPLSGDTTPRHQRVVHSPPRGALPGPAAAGSRPSVFPPLGASGGTSALLGGLLPCRAVGPSASPPFWAGEPACLFGGLRPASLS